MLGFNLVAPHLIPMLNLLSLRCTGLSDSQELHAKVYRTDVRNCGSPQIHGLWDELTAPPNK